MKKLVGLLAIIIALCISSFAQKKTLPQKADPLAATMFTVTIEHNGEKKELKNTQFESYGGTAFTNDSAHGLMTLYYGANNDKKNDEMFSVSGSLDNDAKGTFQLGEGKTHFSFMTTQLTEKPELFCQKGAYEITAMPLKGGYVEGSFSIACIDANKGEEAGIYNLSGSFRFLRQ